MDDIDGGPGGLVHDLSHVLVGVRTTPDGRGVTGLLDRHRGYRAVVRPSARMLSGLWLYGVPGGIDITGEAGTVVPRGGEAAALEAADSRDTVCDRLLAAGRGAGLMAESAALGMKANLPLPVDPGPVTEALAVLMGSHGGDPDPAMVARAMAAGLYGFAVRWAGARGVVMREPHDWETYGHADAA